MEQYIDSTLSVKQVRTPRDDDIVRRVPSEEVAEHPYHFILKEPDPQPEDNDSDDERTPIFRNQITILTRKAENSDELYKCIQDHERKLNFMVSHRSFKGGRTPIRLAIPLKEDIILNVPKIGEYVDTVEEVPLSDFKEYPVKILVTQVDDVCAPFMGKYKMIGDSNSPLIHDIVNAHFKSIEFELPDDRKASINMPMHAGANRMWNGYIPPNTNLYLKIRK